MFFFEKSTETYTTIYNIADRSHDGSEAGVYDR